MKKSFLVTEEDYIVNEYLNAKKSILVLAKEFGCSTAPIKRLLNERNIKICNKNWYPKLSKVKTVQIINDYKEYKNIVCLYKKYNLSTYFITKVLRENGVEIINLFMIPKIDEKYWDDIIKLYYEGNSLTMIAKRYNVSRKAIRLIFKKRNIEVVNRKNVARMNENIFEKIDSKDKSYWLVFIYADGYISKGEFGV